MHVAAANGYTEVLDFLLRQEDIELNIPDNEGWTPFHAAVCWNQPEAMKKLALKGSDMDLKNIRGETPYGMCVEGNTPYGMCVEGDTPYGMCVAGDAPYGMCVEGETHYGMCVEGINLMVCVKKGRHLMVCV